MNYYEDGYQTGSNWDASWRPGGPWVMGKDPRDSPDIIARCEETKNNNREWLKGFDDGLKKQKGE